MRDCTATSLTLFSSIDIRDSSDKLAVVIFAYTAPSDPSQSTVCSTFRVTIRLLRNSGIRLSIMSVHCGVINRFKTRQQLLNTRNVFFK